MARLAPLLVLVMLGLAAAHLVVAVISPALLVQGITLADQVGLAQVLAAGQLVPPAEKVLAPARLVRSPDYPVAAI
jgi:hypothetical protein